MILALRHRGPDQFGYLLDDGVGLAHARLSIVDLSHGAQPISNESEECGSSTTAKFSTTSSSGVSSKRKAMSFARARIPSLVHAYEQYGDDSSRA